MSAAGVKRPLSALDNTPHGQRRTLTLNSTHAEVLQWLKGLLSDKEYEEVTDAFLSRDEEPDGEIMLSVDENVRKMCSPSDRSALPHLLRHTCLLLPDLNRMRRCCACRRT